MCVWESMAVSIDLDSNGPGLDCQGTSPLAVNRTAGGGDSSRSAARADRRGAVRRDRDLAGLAGPVGEVIGDGAAARVVGGVAHAAFLVGRRRRRRIVERPRLV